MQQFDKVTAVFKPKKTDTLTEEARQRIGETLIFKAVWIIEKQPYKGQWAFYPVFEDKTHFLFGWVPEEDLDIIGELNV